MKEALAPQGELTQAPTMLRVAIALAAVGSQAERSADTSLSASGKWVVDYAKDYCVLSRDGTGGGPGVAFRTRPLALRHDVLIYLPRTGAPRATSTGSVAVADGKLGSPRFVEEAEPANSAYRFINTIVSNDEFEAIAKAGSLRVNVPQKIDLRVELPQIEKAVAALRRCEDDLAQRWGLNLSYIRNWKTPPRPKLPWAEVTNKREWPDWSRDFGKNKARFTVDETGKPADCAIMESSGSRKLDNALCDAVMKMPFEPALDVEGRPVRSVQMFGTYWTHILKTRYEFWP